MHAYIDEAIRQNGDGLYVVAAVIVAPIDLDRARRAALGVPKAGQRRFHWHNESEAQRLLMLQTIRALDLRVRAYQVAASARKLERARALCIERLVWDLVELDIDELTFETRQAHNDARDRRTVIHAQKAGVAPGELHYGFERPEAEPLLWLADASAGAVTAALAGERGAYLEAIAGLVTIVQVRRR
jgi:hypothetical protein